MRSFESYTQCRRREGRRAARQRSGVCREIRRGCPFELRYFAHMGWEDMATSAPIAELAAQTAIRSDSEDPWAHYALGSVYLFTRRFDNSLARV